MPRNPTNSHWILSEFLGTDRILLNALFTQDEQSDCQILSNPVEKTARVHRIWLRFIGSCWISWDRIPMGSCWMSENGGLFRDPIETQIFRRFPTPDNFPSEPYPKAPSSFRQNFVRSVWIQHDLIGCLRSGIFSTVNK